MFNKIVVAYIIYYLGTNQEKVPGEGTEATNMMYAVYKPTTIGLYQF